MVVLGTRLRQQRPSHADGAPAALELADRDPVEVRGAGVRVRGGGGGHHLAARGLEGRLADVELAGVRLVAAAAGVLDREPERSGLEGLPSLLLDAPVEARAGLL